MGVGRAHPLAAGELNNQLLPPQVSTSQLSGMPGLPEREKGLSPPGLPPSASGMALVTPGQLGRGGGALLWAAAPHTTSLSPQLCTAPFNNQEIKVLRGEEACSWHNSGQQRGGNRMPGG